MVYLLLMVGWLSRAGGRARFPARALYSGLERHRLDPVTVMLDRDLFDFLEHTADAAFAVTDSGEICSWNASAEALFGFGRAEVVGKTCFELFQGRGALGTLVCTENCHVRECAAQHTAIPDFDLEVKTGSGRRIWVNISTMIHEDPRTGRRRIVHLARSIAGRKRTELLVGRMLRMSKRLVDIAEDSARPAPVTPLSDQEHRVLRSFSEGRSPADIGRDLHISPQTLRNHLHHINQKLGTHNRLEAVLHAIRRQLI
jgi:PAS domain S-box-containing protein